jgi:hypothetical protein
MADGYVVVLPSTAKRHLCSCVSSPGPMARSSRRDCRPDGTRPAQRHLGSTTKPEKYLKPAERRKCVTIVRQDYEKLAACHGKDTFFFIGPA